MEVIRREIYLLPLAHLTTHLLLHCLRSKDETLLWSQLFPFDYRILPTLAYSRTSFHQTSSLFCIICFLLLSVSYYFHCQIPWSILSPHCTGSIHNSYRSWILPTLWNTVFTCHKSTVSWFSSSLSSCLSHSSELVPHRHGVSTC